MNDSLAVVLLTYAPNVESPRHEYAKRTSDSLLKYIHYTGPLRWHIADDGSPPEHIEALKVEMPWSITNANRQGYGASYNLAIQALHADCDFFLMVEDDWELTRELDLDPLVSALKAGIGCIRLGYLGWTQDLGGIVRGFAGQTFLALDPDSPEPHVWSGHPRLETKEFQCRVGPWPEGLDPGTTEFVVAHRREAREGVVWPLDLGVRAGQVNGALFAHIGAVRAE